MEVNNIIGDLHLGEDGMFNREYSKTFKSKEEYYTSLIRNYNKVNNDNTKTIFLGDLGVKLGIEEVIPQLKGYKILILGNHDKYSKEYYLKYFDEVYNYPLFINKRTVLSHEPIPVEPGMLNVHGHTHRIDLDSENHLNICVERTKFAPVNIRTISEKLFSIEKPNKKFLNEWYKDIMYLSEGTEREDFVLYEDRKLNIEETKKLLRR